MSNDRQNDQDYRRAVAREEVLLEFELMPDPDEAVPCVGETSYTPNQLIQAVENNSPLDEQLVTNHLRLQERDERAPAERRMKRTRIAVVIEIALLFIFNPKDEKAETPILTPDVTQPNEQESPIPATGGRIEASLGSRGSALNITLTPKQLISDSRCAQGVQCIWAGTVEVLTVMETPVGHGEHVIKLGEPFVFGDTTITLIEVRPIPQAGIQIPLSSYVFVFELKKN